MASSTLTSLSYYWSSHFLNLLFKTCQSHSIALSWQLYGGVLTFVLRVFFTSPVTKCDLWSGRLSRTINAAAPSIFAKIPSVNAVNFSVLLDPQICCSIITRADYQLPLFLNMLTNEYS